MKKEEKRASEKVFFLVVFFSFSFFSPLAPTSPSLSFFFLCSV